MDEDSEDELFDWAANTYQSDSLGGATPTIDLSQYQVTFFHNKEPNGDEYLDPFEVTKVDGLKQP